jgi:anaerobic ribonucleoside-triphosphate reductase activating protein
MLPTRGGTWRTVDELEREILSTPDIEGVSFLGGEPFEQAAPLGELAKRARSRGLSVMVFSGYTLLELRARAEALLEHIDLLVDGRFDRAQPDGRRWIGSRNQVLHFLSDRYQPDDPRFSAANTVEIRLEPRSIAINGWAPAAKAFKW